MSGQGHRGQYYPMQGHADPRFHTPHSFELQKRPHPHPRPLDGLPSSDTSPYGHRAMISVPALPIPGSRYHPYPRTPPPPPPDPPSNPVIVRPVATRALNREEVAKLIGPSITDSLAFNDPRRLGVLAVNYDIKTSTHFSHGKREGTGRNTVERRSQVDVKVEERVARGLSEPGHHSRPREQHDYPTSQFSPKATPTTHADLPSIIQPHAVKREKEAPHKPSSRQDVAPSVKRLAQVKAPTHPHPGQSVKMEEDSRYPFTSSRRYLRNSDVPLGPQTASGTLAAPPSPDRKPKQEQEVNPKLSNPPTTPQHGGRTIHTSQLVKRSPIPHHTVADRKPVKVASEVVPAAHQHRSATSGVNHLHDIVKAEARPNNPIPGNVQSSLPQVQDPQIRARKSQATDSPAESKKPQSTDLVKPSKAPKTDPWDITDWTDEDLAGVDLAEFDELSRKYLGSYATAAPLEDEDDAGEEKPTRKPDAHADMDIDGGSQLSPADPYGELPEEEDDIWAKSTTSSQPESLHTTSGCTSIGFTELSIASDDDGGETLHRPNDESSVPPPSIFTIHSDDQLLEWLQDLKGRTARTSALSARQRRDLASERQRRREATTQLHFKHFPSSRACAKASAIAKRLTGDSTDTIFHNVSHVTISGSGREGLFRAVHSQRPAQVRAHLTNFTKLAKPKSICVDYNLTTTHDRKMAKAMNHLRTVWPDLNRISTHAALDELPFLMRGATHECNYHPRSYPVYSRFRDVPDPGSSSLGHSRPVLDAWFDDASTVFDRAKAAPAWTDSSTLWEVRLPQGIEESALGKQEMWLSGRVVATRLKTKLTVTSSEAAQWARDVMDIQVDEGRGERVCKTCQRTLPLLLPGHPAEKLE